MKYYELDTEEKQILEDFEKGEFVSVPNLEKEKTRLQKIAQNTLNKTKNINIRMTQGDLHKLKVKAAEAGLPYQTLVSSLIHRFVSK